MPYIDNETRKSFDGLIKDIVLQLKSLEVLDKRGGLANYVISRIVSEAMEPEDGYSYTSISRAVSVFTDAKTEMERRLMGPKEDFAIKQNGDLPIYERYEKQYKDLSNLNW